MFMFHCCIKLKHFHISKLRYQIWKKASLPLKGKAVERSYSLQGKSGYLAGSEEAAATTRRGRIEDLLYSIDPEYAQEDAVNHRA